LVEHLTELDPPTRKQASLTRLKKVWFCDDQASCAYVCSSFRAAGIPFKVLQEKHQHFWNLVEHYEVFVPADFYDQAKVIAERGVLDFSDTGEDQKIMELPDAGQPLSRKKASREVGSRNMPLWKCGPRKSKSGQFSKKTRS
jgi:hypothetical protein